MPVKRVNFKISGIKIHDTRMIRLIEILMHTGTTIDGLTSAFIHKTIVKKYNLSPYTINQLRYDLRKMKAHGLVGRNGKHYSYRFTKKGMKVAAIFILFHQRISGPLSNSIFNRKPSNAFVIDSKLEDAYHNADESIQNIINLLTA